MVVMGLMLYATRHEYTRNRQNQVQEHAARQNLVELYMYGGINGVLVKKTFLSIVTGQCWLDLETMSTCPVASLAFCRSPLW